MTSDKPIFQTPSDEIFDDIKNCSIKIWNTYDDTFGYATEKTRQIKAVKNYQDNVLFIVAMFDYKNIARLLNTVKPKSAEWLFPYVKEEIIAGKILFEDILKYENE